MEKKKDEWSWLGSLLGVIFLYFFGGPILIDAIEEFRAKSAKDTEPRNATNQSLKNLMLGQAADFDGLKVTVLYSRKETVQGGSDPIFIVQVKYENSREEAVPFSESQWKIEDPNGARTQQWSLSGTLGSGEIAPHGMRVGTVRFTTADEVKRVVFDGGWRITRDQFRGEKGIATWKLK